MLLRAQPGSGKIVLHLRESVDGSVDIATVKLEPLPGDEPAFHHFALPLQEDVNGKSFFLLLESPESNATSPLLVPYNLTKSSALTLYLDGVSVPGHVSFKLHYRNLYILKDLAVRAVSYGGKTLWLLFLSALLCLLPGGAVVVWLLREGDWIERLIVAVGLSVAINAVLVYATMTGIRLNSAIVIGFLSLLRGPRHCEVDTRLATRAAAARPSQRSDWASETRSLSISLAGGLCSGAGHAAFCCARPRGPDVGGLVSAHDDGKVDG